MRGKHHDDVYYGENAGIGVLKVLGTIRGDIFKMFLTEALIVGVIGGAAGLILSFIAKWLIPVIFASQELRCVLPWWLAVCGVLFAGAVAIAARGCPRARQRSSAPTKPSALSEVTI